MGGRDAPALPGGVEGLEPVEVPELHAHGVARLAGRRFRAEVLNWRLGLVRLLTSALAVSLAVVVLPGLHLASWGVGEFLLIGAVFGLLNAIVKPVLQFFTLRYLLASYGLVVVLINAALLALMSWILGGELTARGLLPFLLGGLFVGFFGLMLDTVCGATPPIVDRDAPVFDTASRSGAPAVEAAP